MGLGLALRLGLGLAYKGQCLKETLCKGEQQVEEVLEGPFLHALGVCTEDGQCFGDGAEVGELLPGEFVTGTEEEEDAKCVFCEAWVFRLEVVGEDFVHETSLLCGLCEKRCVFL